MCKEYCADSAKPCNLDPFALLKIDPVTATLAGVVEGLNKTRQGGSNWQREEVAVCGALLGSALARHHQTSQ